MRICEDAYKKLTARILTASEAQRPPLQEQLNAIQSLRNSQNETGCYQNNSRSQEALAGFQAAGITADNLLAIHRAASGTVGAAAGAQSPGLTPSAGASQEATPALGSPFPTAPDEDEDRNESIGSMIMKTLPQAVAVGAIGYGVGCLFGEFGCEEKEEEKGDDEENEDEENPDDKDRVELPDETPEELSHCELEENFGKTSCRGFFQASCTAKHDEKGCTEYNKFFCGFGHEKPQEAPGLDSGYCHRQLANRFCSNSGLDHCVSCQFIKDRSSPPAADCAQNHDLCLPNLTSGEQRQFAQSCPGDPILLRSPVSVANSYFAPAQSRTNPRALYASSTVRIPVARNTSSTSVASASSVPIQTARPGFSNGISGPQVNLFQHSSKLVQDRCESGALKCP